MAKVVVNGKEVEVPQGATILQACELAGAEIPRFCYHDRLKIAGNCRMCLVQVEKMPKPVASCAMPASEGMVIHTDSTMVKDAREGTMELLLINHPLDCPICDQGGECDLQDQAVAYGKGTSKYTEHKRAVKDKYMGPLVKTHMTRCIQCTRCIRFITDVAGVPELGAIHRGEHMEITTYVEKSLTSELSGNIIDLCPVGALTSLPYAFKARNWELSKMESIDVMDALGSNIRVDYKGKEVMRILPKNNDAVNEEWISDKSRFSYDGLLNQRIDSAYIRKNGKLAACSVEDGVRAIAAKLKKASIDKIAALTGDLVDLESMFVLKELLEKLGVSNFDCRQEGEKFNSSNRHSYLFNTGIEGIANSDACLIIGSNVRKDSPVLNTRIRAKWHNGGYPVAVIGNVGDLTYDVENLGNDLAILDEILAGKSFGKILAKAKNPLIILGIDAVSREDGQAIIAKVMQIAEKFGAIRSDYCGFNILNRSAARVGGMEIAFVPTAKGRDTAGIIKGVESGDIEFLFLLGADEVTIAKKPNCFVVYIGHHGDRGAHLADVILPAAAYTEKDGTYMNIEARPQRARKVVSAPGMALADYDLLLMIANILDLDLGYTNLAGVRSAMYAKYPVTAKYTPVISKDWKVIDCRTKISSKKLEVRDYNFYMTNPIARASKTMVVCTKEILSKENEYEGAR